VYYKNGTLWRCHSSVRTKKEDILNGFLRWEKHGKNRHGTRAGGFVRMQKQLGMATEIHSTPGKGKPVSIGIPLPKAIKIVAHQHHHRL